MPASTRNTTATISIAFRFHVNFYHSYRGDSLDERGIGPDIRIITAILDALDRLNALGVPVRGTWDIENYYSLEQYMPRHAPELIERIAMRVSAGHDEVELMSYNNGIISAHTGEEFDRAMEWAVSNPAGSGLVDRFGERARIVRPQECMITPSQFARYRAVGVEAVSIYYSALPFNGFSTFVPPLPFAARYNPLTLTAPGVDGSVTLIPAYNHGDVADHLPGLRSWVRSMRRRQLREPEPRDLLLLIDMDADDAFWEGIKMPVVPKVLRSFNGLESLVRQVAGLPYVRFARPADYLATHEPVAGVEYGQDTADGSFDGYSSWAEKWENHAVWSLIHRARYRAQAARFLAQADAGTATPELPERLRAALDESLTARLLAMSTTHFGLASPVMNTDRLSHAFARARAATGAADRALEAGRDKRRRPRVVLDPAVERLPPGHGALVTLDTGAGSGADSGGAAGDAPAPELAHAVITRTLGHGDRAVTIRQLLLNPHAAAVTVADVVTQGARPAPLPGARAGEAAAPQLTADAVAGNGIAVRRRPGESLAVDVDGREVLAAPLAGPWVRYAGKVWRSAGIRCEPVAYRAGGGDGAPSDGTAGDKTRGHVGPAVAAGFRRHGEIALPGGGRGRAGSRGASAETNGAPVVRWVDEVLVAAGLPYVFIDVWIAYPETPSHGFDRAKAGRLAREWDARWEEVAPCELVPAIGATATDPATVWKHNFEGAVSHYQIDYHRFSRNRTIDSINNHITNGWVALSGPAGGVLVAQSAALDNSFAFCPLRARPAGAGQEVRMNPFGTYYGSQLQYPTAATGFGRFMAIRMADQLDSYAPSYAGNVSRFGLMLTPYPAGADVGSDAAGPPPPESLQRDALLFATPAVVG